MFFCRFRSQFSNQILQILGKPFVITEILTEIDGIFFLKSPRMISSRTNFGIQTIEIHSIRNSQANYSLQCNDNEMIAVFHSIHSKYTDTFGGVFVLKDDIQLISDGLGAHAVVVSITTQSMPIRTRRTQERVKDIYIVSQIMRH